MLLRQERDVRVLKTGVQQSGRIPYKSNGNFAWLQSGQRSRPLVLSEGGTLSLLSMLGNQVGDSLLNREATMTGTEWVFGLCLLL